MTPSAPAPRAPPVVVLATPRELARTIPIAAGAPLLRAAELRISERRYALARTLLDSAITLSPQLGRAYTLRARLRLEQNQLRDAWSDAEIGGRLGDRWGAEAVTTMVEVRARDSVAARERVKRLGAALTARPALDEDEGVHLAMARAAVGDQAGAADALARIRPVTPALWATLRDPVFDALRRSSRYPRLVQTLERAAETPPGR